MRRLTALAAAAILALTACMEPTEGPADKPTHEASGRWQEWFGDQPGITLLDEEPRLSGHSGPQAVVRANDAQAVESLVEALEQLPDEGLAVTIVVDIDGTRSELRHLPHHTLAESVEELLAPMPKGVRLRAVGYPTEHWMVDEGLLPAEAALDIRYFADDILPVAPELTAPDDHTVSVSDGDFGDSGDEVQQLGGNVEERHWKTTFPEFRALAEGLDAAMSLESPPTAVDYDVIRFQHRASAITAAQQLEDTPLTISTMRGDGSLYLYPQQHWETTVTTRDEPIAFASEHEEAWVGTNSGVRLKYTVPDACAGILDDVPAWDATIALECATRSEGFILVRASVTALPKLFGELKPVAGDSGGGVHWYPDSTKGSLWEGRDLASQIRALRALGWSGEAQLSLTGASTEPGDRWGSSVGFRSTPTGKATDVDGSTAGQRGELIEA